MKLIAKKSFLHGSIKIPGSKSHTLRAVLISSLAHGISEIENPLYCDDTRSALGVATAFGAKCDVFADGKWIITGTNGMPSVPENIIDCGNSGGTTYFTTGIASTINGCSVITGDEQIRKRPIKKLLKAINELGGTAFTTRNSIDAAPVVIKGPITGGTCHLDGLLSSYVTGILLAAPLVDGEIVLFVDDPKEKPYIRMTLQWLKMQGIQYEASDDLKKFIIKGRQKYLPVKRYIPGDWSSAAFPLVAAVVTNSAYTLKGVSIDDVQGDKEIVDVLIRMGAQIKADEEGVHVHPTNKITKGVEVNMENIPDALPALAVAAACSEGDTIFTGIDNVRLKETDRVFVMQKNLIAMGVDVESDKTSMIVHGACGKLKGAIVDSFGDHRIAMAMAVAGMVADRTTEILNAQSVNVSFPGFIDSMNMSGACFNIIED